MFGKGKECIVWILRGIYLLINYSILTTSNKVNYMLQARMYHKSCLYLLSSNPLGKLSNNLKHYAFGRCNCSYVFILRSWDDKEGKKNCVDENAKIYSDAKSKIQYFVKKQGMVITSRSTFSFRHNAFICIVVPFLKSLFFTWSLRP